VFAIVRVPTAAEAHYDQIVSAVRAMASTLRNDGGVEHRRTRAVFYTMTILLKTSVTPHPATGTIDAPAFSIGIAGSAAL